ncbi:hypothetical protein JOB18_026682 [Solea senegalensis]|uniref:Uncharacterized protein n=1 Tax=Solea senegalensis TaxID=28829 RepID=A0AAV6PNS3_SOLSE|nr:hypothetical protein JOB18_026682 [Solea senegalensis]
MDAELTLEKAINKARQSEQKRMSRILEGLEGVVCQMDDVLIWGASQSEDDERLRKRLTRLQEAEVTLNDKCDFSKSRIKFLGQLIDATGVSADPDKVGTVKAMTEPSNVSERLRMQLMRFSYIISHVPGKDIATADVLSRAPTENTAEGLQEEEVSLYVDAVIANLPASDKRLIEIETHQDRDTIPHTEEILQGGLAR